MARSNPILRPIAAAIVLWLGLGMGQTGTGHAEAITMNIPSDKASRQISVVVTKDVTVSKKLPTPELTDARKRMLTGKDVTPDELRQLADLGDSLAAQNYTRYLVANFATSTASDIAYYGTRALEAGHIWSLPYVVDALPRIDPATEPEPRKKAYAAVIYPYAWAGNSLALDALIDLNGEGKLFGPMSKATQDHIVALGEKGGDGRVALRLALMLIQKTDRSKADIDMARHFLKLAQASDNFQVQVTATNLINLLASNGTLMAVKE